jgi:dTDP-4-dehydrorhamnose 3,5-epimerase
MAGLDDVLTRRLGSALDHRGYFFECYQTQSFYEWTGLKRTFVQTNFSHSNQGVIRGLHFQTRHPQGKLVWVVAGEIFDVVVDLRRSSPTFGQWKSACLSATNRMQMWVPEGFAHGFLVTAGFADVFYQATDLYDPESERTLLWNDPRLAIAWPLNKIVPKLSMKDNEGLRLSSCPVFP